MNITKTTRAAAQGLCAAMLAASGAAALADDGLIPIGNAVYAYYLRELYDADPSTLDGDTQVRLMASGHQNDGGALLAEHNMGGSMLGFPALATVGAYDAGNTFWSQTLSPLQGGPARDVRGGRSTVQIAQSFRKDHVDATMRFTFTAGKLQLMDYGSTRGDGFNLIAYAAFDVDVYSNTAADVVWTESQAAQLAIDFHEIGNHDDNSFELTKYQVSAPTASGMDPWTWNCSGCGGPAYGFATATMNAPYRGDIDLSMIPFGSEFTVRFTLETEAFDGRQGETSALAYARDPVETGSGVGFAFSGLTPTNQPVLAPVPEPGTWALLTLGLAVLLRRRLHPD